MSSEPKRSVHAKGATTTTPPIIIPIVLPRPRKSAAIFGAGIAGLTAAHELVERDYSVTVYECEPPSPLEDTCSIGGMARTQWGRTPPDGVPPFAPSPGHQSTARLDPRVEAALKRRIRFKPGTTTPTKAGRDVLDQLIAALQDSSDYRALFFDVRGYSDRPAYAPNTHTTASRRAEFVADELVKKAGCQGNKLSVAGWGLGRPDDPGLPDEERTFVEVRVVQNYLPGEHGYRFFPTFYRNLRETLKRTPVPEERDDFVETSRTVFDSLVPTRSQGVNFVGKEPYILPRRKIVSIQKFFDLLCEALDKSGFSLEDTNRLAIRTFKFMTSCKERRREYEKISWWDFIGGDEYGDEFKRYVENVAQAFVAMSAKECDARTYGDVSVQLYLDQFFEGERIDAILEGPTSIAWFARWRKYLVSQGVRFVRAQLIDFVLDPSKTVVWPQIVVGDDIELWNDTTSRHETHPQLVDASAYVVALNIESIHEILTERPGGMALQGADAERIRSYVLGDATDELPKGALRHLTGIQFFFPSEIKFLPGHSVFPDSPSGLSAIFQPQFWLRKRGWWDGYRGVLSVCIGRWHEPTTAGGKSLWRMPIDQIARSVWDQILAAVPEGDRKRIAEPRYFHLDDGIQFNRGGLPEENLTRMLINLPEGHPHWTKRPGRLYEPKIDDPPPPNAPSDPDRHNQPEERLDGYRVWYDRLVFAGTYMKTYTRLTTMEAANESGRHAVNGLLVKQEFNGDRCAIHDPEDNEFEDLAYFIDLDRELVRRGLPHLVDILDLRSLTVDLLQGRLDLTPFGIVMRGNP